MKKQACSICGAAARVVKGDYQFKQSGLRDVVLLDIDLIKCGECGNIDPVLSGVDVAVLPCWDQSVSDEN